MQYSLNKDLQHLKMTPANIMDINSRLPWFAEQAGRRSISLYPSEMEDAHKLLKITKSECLDIWIRLPRTQMAKIMVQYGRFSCSSWKESVRSFGRTIKGKAIWENAIEAWNEESSKFGMSFVHREKDYSYLCMCMT